MKEILASALFITTTAWILAHLILIKLWGVVSITENNQWILWAEIGMVSLMLILAIERFIKDWRRRS